MMLYVFVMCVALPLGLVPIVVIQLMWEDRKARKLLELPGSHVTGLR